MARTAGLFDRPTYPWPSVALQPVHECRWKVGCDETDAHRIQPHAFQQSLRHRTARQVSELVEGAIRMQMTQESSAQDRDRLLDRHGQQRKASDDGARLFSAEKDAGLFQMRRVHMQNPDSRKPLLQQLGKSTVGSNQ